MVLNPRTNLPWGEIKALTRSSLLVALEPHRQLEWQGSPFSSRPQAKTHDGLGDRKSTRLNSSHGYISYAVFCLKKKKTKITNRSPILTTTTTTSYHNTT